MSLFGFYAPSMTWLAVLAAPLVLFYFLKLKRQRQAVTSLVLWQQVLNDRRVNSPFQRFKRNLLLLLQLLLLLLAVAAASQPYWRGRTTRAYRLPVLIDCSASMAALDLPGGPSRLDAAKRKVRDIIVGCLPDQEMCLVSFGRTARKLTDFTSNKRVLHEALAAVECEDVPSDIEDALRLTQALARSFPFDEVMLFSDGNFPTRADFELSFTLNYQKLPPAGCNFGITSLNARRTPDGMWDVFVRVEGSPEAQGPATVEVRRDDEPVGKEDVSIGKGESQRIVFRVSGEEAALVDVRLTSAGFDSLASDNRAFITLPALRPLWVWVAPSLGSFRHALAQLRGIRLFPHVSGTSTETNYDLVVTDRPEDLALDARTCLYVGMIPEVLRGFFTVDEGTTEVVDWKRNSPLLQHVQLVDLLILGGPRSTENFREADLENLGYEVLVHGVRGPLLVEKRETDRLSYCMLFHSDRSTLPYRIGFPILVSNLVRQSMHEAGLTEVRANQTGVLPPVAVTSRETMHRIEGPGGYRRQEKSAPDRSGVTGVAAPRVGVYDIYEGNVKQATVGASLLSESETTLTSVDRIQFQEDLSVSARQVGPRVDKTLWPTLALIAFALCLFEWLYFHRAAGWFVQRSRNSKLET